MSWSAKLKMILAVLNCREAWTLPLPVWKALLFTKKPFMPTLTDEGVVFHLTFPPVGGKSFSRYLRGVKNLAAGKRTPLEIHISLTDRCPCKCEFCSNIGSTSDNPSLHSLEKIIAEGKKAGAAVIAFTGGEPGLRADLERIVGLCGKDLQTVLYSSGCGLNARRIRELKRAGLGKIYISIDHFKSEIHNRIRGNSGSFDMALRAIECSRDSGLYTVLQAVLHPGLLESDDIERYLQFAKMLEVQEVMFLEPKPNKNNVPSFITPALKKRFRDLQITCAREKTRPKVSTMSFFESADFMGCVAGVSFLYISASGDVFPCDVVPLSFGNIHDDGLEIILQRISRLIPAPSRKCLCETMQDVFEINELPLCREKTTEILKDYEPGPPPELMKWFKNGRISMGSDLRQRR